MKLNPNDPKITAYLLGELEEAERREIENVLSEDAESRNYVEELRETTQALVAEFALDPELALTPSHRRAIEEELAGSRKGTHTPVDGRIRGEFFSGFFGWRFGVVFSTALVALLASIAFFNRPLESPHSQPETVAFTKPHPPASESGPVSQFGDLQRSPGQSAGESLARSEAPAAAPIVENSVRGREEIAEMLEVIGGKSTESAPNPAPTARSWGASLPQVAVQTDEVDDAPAAPAPAKGKAEALLADSKGLQIELQQAATQVDLDSFVIDPDDSRDPQLNWSENSTTGNAPTNPPVAHHELRRQMMEVNELSTLGSQLQSQSGERPYGVDPSLGEQLPQVTQRQPQSNGAYFFPNAVLSEQERPLIVSQSGSLVLDAVPSQPGSGLGGFGGALGYAPGLTQRFEDPSIGSLTYPGSEDYESFVENPFKSPVQEPLSTLSIDVDTASYANVRRFLNQGQLPPKDSIRIEEMINYFDFDYPQPTGEEPFSVQVEVSQCPWKPEHQLARLGIQGKEVSMDDRGAANLVFLLDVSGSMEPANKLPLVKQGMKLLLNQLQPSDRVAIVTYAGSSGIALPSTACGDKPKITNAIEALCSGGSTNGASGIELAYKTARENFSNGGINRVILATDGDFNVGITDNNALVELIEREARSGVFLSVLGFGMGNLKDDKLEGLADKGNGNYAYIDTLQEAQKVFVDQLGGTLLTIAKDVKIQIELNPGKVGAYRLIGYENRKLAAQDFNDDTKDAGEVGAGHSVTALYELVPPGIEITVAGVDPLKYQTAGTTNLPIGNPPAPAEPALVESDEMMTVKLRYKQPDGQTSKKVEISVKSPVVHGTYSETSTDYKFAAAVAEFGMILRDSAFKANANLDQVLELARQGKGADEDGYRAEFLQLVKLAQSLTK